MIRDTAVPDRTIRLAFLVQAGFLLKEPDGSVLCIDPYLSDSQAEALPRGRWSRRYPPPIRPEELDADGVLITHGHGDHFDAATLRPLLARKQTGVVAPADLGLSN